MRRRVLVLLAYGALALQVSLAQEPNAVPQSGTISGSTVRAEIKDDPLPAEEALPSAAEIERQHSRQLLSLRRVYVDQLAGGETAKQIRDMIIAALERSRLFIVTEDEGKADAYLRGSGEDSIFTETRASREGINARVGGRASSGAANSRSRYGSDSVSATLGVGESDDFYSKERKHEARASVRLVARDGDVLWSSTQESQGAKYKGSAADVAEKIGRELADAYARARKEGSPQPAAISDQRPSPSSRPVGKK